MCKCRYCDKEFTPRGRRKDVCGTCEGKASVLPSFVEARDNLRVLLGRKPMGRQYYGKR